MLTRSRIKRIGQFWRHFYAQCAVQAVALINSKGLCSPCSPALLPTEYFCMGLLQRNIYRKNPRNMDEPKTNISNISAAISPTILQRVPVINATIRWTKLSPYCAHDIRRKSDISHLVRDIIDGLNNWVLILKRPPSSDVRIMKSRRL
jgi:hypothetical protein